MIWTKEVPVKPGKYIARYKDEDTGRTRYFDVMVEEFGSTPFFRGVPHNYLYDIYGRVEYSKRVGNAEQERLCLEISRKEKRCLP